MLDDEIYHYEKDVFEKKAKNNKEKIDEKSSAIQNSVGSRILTMSPNEKINTIKKDDILSDTSSSSEEEEIAESKPNKMRFSMRLAKKESSMDSFTFRTKENEEEDESTISNITDNDTCSVLKED